MRGLEFQKDEEAVDRRGWVAVVRGEATTAMSPGDFRASGNQVHRSPPPSVFPGLMNCLCSNFELFPIK
jgi:hypothetical protein